MKSTRIKLAIAALATLVTVSTQANPVTGSLWFVDNTTASDATPANVPGTTPNVTFSVNAPLDFDSNVSGYKVGDFLTGGGATILTGSSAALNNTLDNGGGGGVLIDFKGFVTVTSGESFTASHDDGLTLTIDGITVIDATGPTSATITTENYSGPAGTYSFDLVYGECCGPPAVLTIDLPLEGVPDGGSTMALLGGALTMMGVVARRFRK